MSTQHQTDLSPEGLTVPLSACLAALRPLARVGAHLAPLNRTHWRLNCRKNGDGTGDELPVSLVMELCKAGFILIGKDGRGRLSPGGRQWLNRQLTSGGPVVRHHRARRMQPFTAEDGRSAHLVVNLQESPLSWLRSRRDRKGEALISEAEYEAGERLRRDFTAAGLTPQVTAAWSSVAGSTRRRRKNGIGTNHEQKLSDAAYAARAQVAAALSAVGPEFESILLDTCCFLRGVEDSEIRYGWPRRSAKLVLRLALSALARHYAKDGPVRADDDETMARMTMR